MHWCKQKDMIVCIHISQAYTYCFSLLEYYHACVEAPQLGICSNETFPLGPTCNFLQHFDFDFESYVSPTLKCIEVTDVY